ncbi:MAG: 5-formyltetrahydrofolate cyclo-ligase [Proteobacteria bacterium]|nr:MAG: 5-formyltetrahydrofolate cyclo-ligase [Pseudomonadota bacterium]PIE40513.1 MAG: 5-formyltetrahydrofolate cyclo-ligase [Gammaproteobacteria bacterium]
MLDKKLLRSAMRKRRRSLGRRDQSLNSRLLRNQLCKLPDFRHCKKIALYLANDGEIDPVCAVRFLWETGKQVYLPVLHPLGKRLLYFIPFTPETRLIRNKYGIHEPEAQLTRRIPAWSLDMVLLPLVAFDRSGGRLGMGGGYYDRTFRFLLNNNNQSPPFRTNLIGLAHSFQEVETLPTEEWDVPLAYIATEKELFQKAGHQQATMTGGNK